MADSGTHDLTRGLNGLLGFRLAEWRAGFARVTVDLDERHRNRQGGLHGGVTATLVDAATGYCGIYEPDPEKRRGNVTVSLHVNFVSRPRGASLTCTAETIRAGRRLYFASAEVHDDTGNLIATAEAVYAYIDRDPGPRGTGGRAHPRPAPETLPRAGPRMPPMRRPEPQ